MSRPLGLIRRGWAERKPGQWWKEDAPRRGLRFFPGSILVCRVLRFPIEEFRRQTGRAQGGSGFLVDSEVFWVDGRTKEFEEWVYHQESRASTEQEADAIVRRMMAWIDRRSLRTLADVPGAGDLAMSKLPKDEGFGPWSELGRIVREWHSSQGHPPPSVCSTRTRSSG